MKKTLKRTCAVALALAATAGVSGVDKVIASNNNLQTNNQNVVSAQGTALTDGVLAISKYSKTVTLGEEFTMPTATLGGVAFTGDVVVSTPSGKKLTTAEIGDDGKFTIDETGTYTITYTQDSYVGEVTFVSSVSMYSIKLETNNDKILPAKVSKSYTGDIYVPTYVVTDKNGDKVENPNVKIAVTTPTFETLSVVDGKISYTSLVKGTYTVTYSVYTADGNFLTKIEQTFKCVEGDAYSADDDLVLSYTKEKPESVNIGKTVELPGLTGKVGTESVPVYYTIEVLKNGTDVVAADTKVGNTDKVVLERNENGTYSFTANEEANFYTIKYTAKSALNAKEAVTEFVIDTVEDNIKPTPIVVEPYETDATTDLKNVDYKLKSNFNSENIEILPIYAEDLGTFNFSDYKFKREIRNSSYEVLYTDTESPNKTILFNSTYADADVPATAIVAKGEDGNAITLTDGTYYVYYTATDKAGNEETVNYKFVVDALFDGRDDNGEVKPVVTFNDVFFASVDAGENIEFSKVTFSDDNDERLDTTVYYEFRNDDEDVLATEELELNDLNKYVISTENMPEGATKVVIIAKATNDSGFVGEDSREVVINSEITGTTAPIVTTVQGNITNTAVQGSEITLPTIIFEDDIVSSLNAEVSITCVTSEGKTVSYDAYNAMAIRNETAGTYTYANATFTAATAGTYTVAVKATDAAGNVVVQFLTYEVSDASYTGKLRFTNIGLSDTTIELGETFKLPTATIVGTNSADYAYQVRLKKGPSKYELNNDKFTPKTVGDYTLEYVMYLVSDPTVIISEESVEVNITVEDTTKPEIYVNWKASIVNGESATGEILGAYEKGIKLLLPKFTAYDLSNIDTSKSLITITCSSSSSSRVIKFEEMAKEYDKGAEGTMMYYTFAKDGEYTITYTAYDKEGNSDKKVFTIKIGDLDAPEFEVKDEVVKSEYKVGDEIKIDLTDDSLNYFTITDADTTIEKTDIKAVLTVNGVEVKNQETEAGKFKFKLEDAGEYELKFTVKDSAGNESEVVKTFSIAEKGESNLTSAETLGIVLIVVSVVVLAGVVVYFVISKKKMDRLYK